MAGNDVLYDNLPAPGADPNGHTANTQTTQDFGPGTAVHIRRVIIINDVRVGITTSATWKLEHSNDGSAWTEVGEFTMAAGRGNTQVPDFPPSGNYRFRRLAAKRGTPGGGDAWIKEVKMLEENFARFIDLNGPAADGYLNRASIYAETGQHQAALQDLDHAILPSVRL